MPTHKRRRVVPGVLIAAGIAGLSLAAATQLDLDWDGTYQAGTTTVDADCQKDPIDVSFSEPEFLEDAPDIPWSVGELSFTGISDACLDLSYEVAVRTSGEDNQNWLSLANGTVPDLVPLTLSVPLADIDPQTISDVALTIHGTKASEQG